MKIVKVQIKLLNDLARIPQKGTLYSGGYDIVATEIIKETSNKFLVKTGIAMSIPFNYKLTVVPRSSITKTELVLTNSPALIDPDYRGEICLRFTVLNGEFPYNVGERVAQCYLEEIIPIDFELVNELDETVRGEGGFGSTGRSSL